MNTPPASPSPFLLSSLALSKAPCFHRCLSAVSPSPLSPLHFARPPARSLTRLFIQLLGAFTMSMGERCSVRIEPISYICVCYESPLIWQRGSSVNAAFTRSVPLPYHTMQATHPLAARSSRGNERASEPPFPYFPLPPLPRSLTECALSLPPSLRPSSPSGRLRRDRTT